jgi:multiple sugar transport system permease protein
MSGREPRQDRHSPTGDQVPVAPALERDPPDQGQGSRPAKLPKTAPACNTDGAAAGARGRLVYNLRTKAWVHVLLLLGVGIFLFPFLWMLSTSVKTDEELVETAVLPALPTFQPTSPYVRDVEAPEKPPDVPPARWHEMLPTLLGIAKTSVAEAQGEPAYAASAGNVDREKHREAAAQVVVHTLVAKLHKALWTGPEQALMEGFTARLTPAVARGALDHTLARLELQAVQLRTLSAHIYNEGKEFHGTWRVESGPGTVIDAPGSHSVRQLHYHFDSPTAAPIVLMYAFPIPRTGDGQPIDPADLHKLSVTLRADDSWHHMDATLDWGESRWASRRTTYIAQFRPMSVIFQPPTFDDATDRAQVWVPLEKTGPRPDGHDPPVASTARLRIIISPSGTAQAIYGKATRNYERAFLSVPFWRYVGNSVILVALTTGGAVFSASFVAYAFARLNWPGRSVAFVLLLSTMMLPAQVTMIPSFMIWRALGWYNTLNPLWVPSWFGGAFFIFLMVQHMKTLPKELEEAARLDGLNAVQTWWYIIMPQVKPSLAAIAIMTFLGAWNEFMGPLIYLRDQDKFPLSLGLFGMRIDQGGDWTMMMAGNMLMTVPVIVIFFLFQRYFIQGMTMSGMKG